MVNEKQPTKYIIWLDERRDPKTERYRKTRETFQEFQFRTSVRKVEIERPEGMKMAEFQCLCAVALVGEQPNIRVSTGSGSAHTWFQAYYDEGYCRKCVTFFLAYTDENGVFWIHGNEHAQQAKREGRPFPLW